jgi:hypothetical protein
MKKLMNSIEFDIVPDDGEPSLIIFIDRINIFSLKEIKDTFIPTDAPSFLFNEYMWSESEENDVYNGIMLIGTCTCGCQGCDDLLVKISTNEYETKWTIIADRNGGIQKDYIFNATRYKDEIAKLNEKYYSYFWETSAQKIIRLCNEYIRTYKTKNGKNIDGVEFDYIYDDENDKYTDKLNNIMKIYYYDNWEPMGDGFGTPKRIMELQWNGKTLENALGNLRIFAEKELIKNPKQVPERGQQFRLLFTKDKSVLENN